MPDVNTYYICSLAHMLWFLPEEVRFDTWAYINCFAHCVPSSDFTAICVYIFIKKVQHGAYHIYIHIIKVRRLNSTLERKYLYSFAQTLILDRSLTYTNLQMFSRKSIPIPPVRSNAPVTKDPDDQHSHSMS